MTKKDFLLFAMAGTALGLSLGTYVIEYKRQKILNDLGDTLEKITDVIDFAEIVRGL
jgi:hypothetical protein